MSKARIKFFASRTILPLKRSSSFIRGRTLIAYGRPRGGMRSASVMPDVSPTAAARRALFSARNLMFSASRSYAFSCSKRSRREAAEALVRIDLLSILSSGSRSGSYD